MKSIHTYREQYLNPESQVAVIDSNGILVSSCHTLFNLRDWVGKSAFESFDMLRGIEATLFGLTPEESPFVLPAMEISIGGNTLLCDLYFFRETPDEGYNLVWSMQNMNRTYERLRVLHQQKNESLIESELVQQQHKLLEHYVERLEKANQELDRFAYIVSHDLKTPLRGIRNLTSWIAEDLGTELPDEVRNHIVMLQRQVLKMDALIEGVLQYSRAGREKLQKVRIQVSDLVAEIIEDMQVPDNFKVVVDPDMPILNTYHILLQQVLTNLISNAIRHNDKENAKIHIRCQRSEDIVTFRVEDNGPGIDGEFHDRIFEIFQTLNPKSGGGGTGIGLAIVKKIVQEMGGEVWVESEKGNGAHFCFSWPTA